MTTLCAIVLSLQLLAEATTERAIIKAADGKCTVADKAAEPKVGEEKITFYESPSKKSWRLVHDGTQVIALFESDGITWTKHTLQCGTEEECRAEIERLKLLESKE